MIVHRLGRTILLDEFDVHSHLLRLEKVIIWDRNTTVLISRCDSRMVGPGFVISFSTMSYVIYPWNLCTRRTKPVMNWSVKIEWWSFSVRGKLRQVSKVMILILSLSTSVNGPQLSPSETNEDRTQSRSSRGFTAAAILEQIREIVNAKNNAEDETSQNSTFSASPFQRTVDWTFENMRMLIGSDLPIFGDEKHPAVSLRLR